MTTDIQDQRKFWEVLFADSLRIGNFRIAELQWSGGHEVWATLEDGDDYPIETSPTLQEAITYCVNAEVYKGWELGWKLGRGNPAPK
jgi:hypothetical protein